MEGIKKYTNLDQLFSLNSRNYQGYYWMSDSKKPVPVDGGFDPILEEKNPFIIEGMLWDNDNNISVMIMHNGDYKIYEYDMNVLDRTDNILLEIVYKAHRFEEFNKIKFKQLWIPEEDVLCENMKVLKMKANIFCGIE